MEILAFELRVGATAEKTLSQIERLLEGDLDSNETYKLSNALCSVSRSVSEIARGSRTKANLLAQIRAELCREIRRQMVGYPELCSQVLQIIDSSTEQLAGKYGSDLLLEGGKADDSE